MATSSNTKFVPGPRLIDGSELNKGLEQPTLSTETAAVATGTTRATAKALKAALTVFGTVAASTGAALDSTLPPGSSQIVYNDGASTLTVYANDTIDGVAGATGVSLSAAARCVYTRLAGGTWKSALLGAVSA